ncbi:MAG: hypothetical protein ACOCXA_03250, partial [Planctomycetota bacterium]
TSGQHAAARRGTGNPSQERRRNQHLRKPAPAPLKAGNGHVDLGQTDPGLRRYKQGGGGGMVKAMAVIVLTLVFVLVILVVLVLLAKPVRDAVRPLLPTGVQRMLLDESQQMPLEPAAPPTPGSDESTP